jgi:hypothetical protein
VLEKASNKFPETPKSQNSIKVVRQRSMIMDPRGQHPRMKAIIYPKTKVSNRTREGQQQQSQTDQALFS